MSSGTLTGAEGCRETAQAGPTLLMLILNLREHFPARISEWFNAGILMSWGGYVLAHPNLFSHAGNGQIFSRMADMVWVNYQPELVWGGIAFGVGALRLFALFVNGAYSRTPIIRLVTAAISAFLWTQVFVGLLAVPNTGLVVYPWLVFIDLVAAYRSGKDAVIAEKRRREIRLGIESVHHRRDGDFA